MKNVLSNIERIISRIETASDGLFLKVAGLSPVLYHSTDVRNLISVLESNTFRLTYSRVNKSERSLSRENLYFMSTSRHALGGYHKDAFGQTSLLVLDGVKLSNKYSGSPVDYWGERFRKADPTKFEAEDRIWANTPTIPNASSYIREIRIYLGDNTDEDYVIRSTKKAVLSAKKLNIPTYVYKDKEAFLTGNKRKSLRLEEWARKTEVDRPYLTFHKRDSEDLQVWFELYFKKDREHLSKRARDRLVYLTWPDTHALLETAIHNSKRSPALPKLVNIWRKEGVKTPEEFIELLRDKWYNT